MGKFAKLVKNEYIKNLKRTSTIVMLILIIAAGFVFPGIVKVASKLNETVFYGDEVGGRVEYNQELIERYENKDSHDSSEVIGYEKAKLIVAYNIDDVDDWRFELVNTAFKELVESCFDDEYFEAVLEEKLSDIDMSLPSEELEALQAAAIASAEGEAMKKAAENVKALPLYKELTAILESNDLVLFYDSQIKLLEAQKLTMTDDVQKAIVQAKIDHFTYLRDNNIYYFAEYEEFDVSMTSPDIFDSRYFDSRELMNCRITVTSYENDIGHFSKSEYQKAKDTLLLREYIIENNIEYNAADTINMNTTYTLDFWTAMGMSASAVSFIGLLLIVIAALSIANEFSNGTIKFLLINPVKRWKILASKYFTVISMGYIMLILLFIVSTLASIIFFGGSLLTENLYEVVDGEVVATAGLWEVFKSYLVNSVEVVVMATLAFAVSSIMRSSAFAIGISMLCMLGGNVVVSILSAMKLDWARYLIFANLDLENIAKGSSSFAYQSVDTAIGVIAVHMVIFWLIAWDAFTKKDL